MKKNKPINTMSLKKILNEIHIHQKRELDKIKSYAFLNEYAISKILKSGVMTEQESLVVDSFLQYKGIRRIDESTIHTINREQKMISEGIISDGFVDYIKKSWDAASDKVTSFGSSVKDAFVKGWDAVKKIWTNFSDMIKALVDKVKAGFNRMMTFISEKIKELTAKLSAKMDDTWFGEFKEKHKFEYDDAEHEFDSVKAIRDHVITYFKTKIAGGGLFEDRVMKGDFVPTDTKGISPDDVDTSMEDIAEAYKGIFSKKQYIVELMNLNEADITNVLIKNPMGRKLADYAILGIKAIFRPLSTLTEYLLEKSAEKLLPVSSIISNKLGGPGPFEFKVLSNIISETYQTWAYGVVGTFSFETIVELISPFIKPFDEALSVVVKIAHAVVFAWAIVSIMENIRELFMEKAKVGTVTSSYKPSGHFKLQEGKLIFVSHKN